MKSRSVGGLTWVVVAAVLLAGACTLDQDSTTDVSFDTKVVDYMLPVGIDGAYEIVRTKVYDSTGTQGGQFELTYDGNGRNTRTDVYEVDGLVMTLAEYYIYTYTVVTYEGEEIALTTRAETYDPDDTLLAYYEVTYDGDFADSYTLLDDYEMQDGTAVPTARRRCTYVKDTDLASCGEYRTEQYFSWDSTDSAWDLESEYACWYDDDGDYTAELYHVIRGSLTDPVLPDDTVDDAYFYVPYARDSAGNVYLQSDCVYLDTADGIPSTLKESNGSFLLTTGIAAAPGAADSFAYDLVASAIGSQVDMLLMAYDDLEPANVVRKAHYVYGEIQDSNVYNFDSEGTILDEATYVTGGEVLDSKTSYRYAEETIGGTTYSVRTIYGYSYSYDAAEELSGAVRYGRAVLRSPKVYSSTGSRRQIGSNHARQDG